MADFWDGIHGFKRKEFECPDNCGFSTVDIELLAEQITVGTLTDLNEVTWE
jgi:hypothetical protein